MITEELDKLAKDHPEKVHYLFNIADNYTDCKWKNAPDIPPNILQLFVRRGVLIKEEVEEDDPNDYGIYYPGLVNYYYISDEQILLDWVDERRASQKEIDWYAPNEFDQKVLFEDFVCSSEDREEILEEVIEAITIPGDGLHILLVGPQASGKTLLFDAIHTLNDSDKGNGGAITPQGWIEMIMEERKRIHIIDEIDKWFIKGKGKRGEMDKETARALGALLPLTEEGLLNIHKHNFHERIYNKGVVLAGANRIDVLMDYPELISRFKGRIFYLEHYTEEEFLEICRIKFVKYPYHLPPDLADEIGRLVWDHDKEVRTAIGAADTAISYLKRGKDPYERVRKTIGRMKRLGLGRTVCPKCEGRGYC